MNTKHTSGPWAVHYNDIMPEIRASSVSIADIRWNGHNEKHGKANARLIAAAPDLLASHMGDDLAKEIAGCLIGDTLTAFLEWRDLQCAAIALAEGRA